MPLMGLVAAALIALSLVWPQGQGDRSWGPFGHTPVQQTPEMKARIQKEKDAAMRRDQAAKKAVEAVGQMPSEAPPPAPPQAPAPAPAPAPQ
ncbi:hypothetical protein [Caulobacter sp. 602-1]|uniref:hypothetical protein n=1 Tax=Caulobacter sp. 602-1 TaxID=2492472 RepID=UPI001F2E2B30|nr:hypothetical protein [Caulobacter sp. 602-1]